VTNASGRALHTGGICNSGTTCAATGQDRRLGDYFTNAIDGNGCVLIASGDTTTPDAITGGARITSLPVFMYQAGGPSLTGGQCVPNPPPNAGASNPLATSAGLPATVGTGGGLWLPYMAALLALILGLLVARWRLTR